MCIGKWTRYICDTATQFGKDLDFLVCQVLLWCKKQRSETDVRCKKQRSEDKDLDLEYFCLEKERISLGYNLGENIKTPFEFFSSIWVLGQDDDCWRWKDAYCFLHSILWLEFCGQTLLLVLCSNQNDKIRQKWANGRFCLWKAKAATLVTLMLQSKVGALRWSHGSKLQTVFPMIWINMIQLELV